jgi:peroxiredoxin
MKGLLLYSTLAVLPVLCLGAYAFGAGPPAPRPTAPRAPFPGRTGGGVQTPSPAPLLGLRDWMNSGPLEPADLSGKVVLVRWFTDGCPFCEASAPSLREMDHEYRDRGLVVIGIFHPKPPGDPSVERMKTTARRFGFSFPVALDADWTALRRWWLDEESKGWTSVTFLVDRAGQIRYVHPGGEYHEGRGGDYWPDHESCHREYREIESTIVRLLNESGP